MKNIDGKFYIEFDEMVQCGCSESYLWKANSTGNNRLPFIKDPDHGVKVLYCWDGMHEKYRRMVVEKFGQPADFIAKTPIREMVERDFKAETFFAEYELAPGKRLPVETANKYTNEASWLNMILTVRSNPKQVVKQGLGLKTIDQFNTHVTELLTIERQAGRVSSQFPTKYRYLNSKLKQYKAEGYACLISKEWGNQKAAKINDEISEAVLLELLCHPNQHNDSAICAAYNKWAVANQYKPIVEETVGNHRRENLWRIQGERQGNKEWYNTFGKVMHRKRPSAPLLLVGSDDNDLDLYFQWSYRNSKGDKVNDYMYRYGLVVIMDGFNDYVLGYAYGDTITKDLVKAAYLDAVYHIKELTGGWYLPHQIQTDRWAVDKNLKGDLATFYSNIARYTPAMAKAPRGKLIEQGFGHTWHNKLKEYPNYAGQNITSQFRINQDALDLNKKSFPHRDEAHRYISHFIQQMRTLPTKKGGNRQQEWIAAFEASELSKDRQISDARMLQLFGTPHNYTNTITNGGLQMSIAGEELVYDIPDNLYLQMVGKKVQVMYDIYNTTRVLVTDNDQLRFVAQEYTRNASALKDYGEGERALINYRLQQKRDHVALIAANTAARKNTLERAGINAHSMLQAGIQPKAIYQQAIRDNEQATQNRNARQLQETNDTWQQQQDAFIDQQIDITKYL